MAYPIGNGYACLYFRGTQITVLYVCMAAVRLPVLPMRADVFEVVAIAAVVPFVAIAA
jgi:hypothetical protein